MSSAKWIFLPLVLTTLWGCSQSMAPVYYSRPIVARFEAYKLTDTNEYMKSMSNSEIGASATLWSTASADPVFGGAVQMNSTMLPFSTAYLVDSSQTGGPSLPISFNGGPVVFSISGSSQFPALTDSITFPSRDIHVTSPSAGSAISQSAGFTITWDYTPGSTDSIVISYGAPVGIDAVVSNQPMIDSGSGLYSTGFATGDNGSFTVPPSALSDFITGDQLSIEVTRYREKYGMDKLGHKYIMEAYTSSTIFGIRLQ